MSKMQFYTADDVAEIMQISKPKAYEIIRNLNNEMEKMGYVTVKGRINATFFHRKTDFQKEVLEDAGL